MFLLWTVWVPVESCDVTLVPAAFALDATVIQKAARDELDSIDEKDLKYYRGLDKYMVGDFKLWCKVCATCDYTPVGGQERVSKLLDAEHEVAHQRLNRLANIDSQVTQNLWTYRLPGLERASGRR